MKQVLTFFLLLSIFISCKNKTQSTNNASAIMGKVIAVIDGDTYDILLEGNKTVRIRMEGIDAPEKGMPYYKVAKNYLGNLCFKSDVRLEIIGQEIHGRTLAYSYLNDGRELSHEMIKAGLAWHYKRYSTDTELSNLEIKARQQKIGLWADAKPMAPWDNRRYHHNGISTKDSFEIR